VHPERCRHQKNDGGFVTRRLRTPWIALVATLVPLGPIASATTYTVTDLGTLGGSQSVATAINARGDVVGWSTLAGETARHAFLYQSRSRRLIDLDPRGVSGASSALAMNDRGRVAGDIAAVGGGGTSHAALFVRGRIIDLGTPLGFSSASAVAINHAGDTLIQAATGLDFVQGFLLHHGHTVAVPIMYAYGLNDRREAVGAVGPRRFAQAVVLGRNGVSDVVPGLDAARMSVATAVNARGDVAGGYTGIDGSTGGAFLERGGVFTDLGTLRGAISNAPVAFALNSHDQVVGVSFGIAVGFEHAFLYDAQLDPPMQDLNDLIPPDTGIVLNQATGINDRGSIAVIGTANGQLGPVRAFLLTPNPSSP
jgi:probable HAF family extracellular repeat protein